MAKKKKTVRREWTRDDIKDLKAHSKARTPVVKIAKMTKRTEGALRQKAIVLGIGLGQSAVVVVARACVYHGRCNQSERSHRKAVVSDGQNVR
ncbi:hypothetical protein ACVWXL_000189 [Bradyrhizobium sp. GM22.5]